MAEVKPTRSKFSRAIRSLNCCVPMLRWATLARATAILAFGAPTDALWALAALGAAIASPQL
jgi:hypothetical protein